MKFPDRKKVTNEVIERVAAFQRNKLYPIMIAFSGSSDKMILKKTDYFISQLNELIVTVAVSKRDEAAYQHLIDILKPRKKITSHQKKKAIEMIKLLIKRLKSFTCRFK